MVSAEDFLALFFGVAVRLGVLAAALGAVFRKKASFGVRGHGVADDVFAGAMAARKLNRNHVGRVYCISLV